MLQELLLAFVGFSLHCQAYPSYFDPHGPSGLERRGDGQIAEWTAMGDSYASGVGAGPQPSDDKNRCFRFPNAYPVVVQAGLNPVPSKFNNVACSGNTIGQIKDKELLDKPEDDGKNGVRPAWGQAPEFVTITMGGNDVGILNLVSTCILSLKLWGMDCDQVIENGRNIIDSQKFKDDLNGLIKAIIDKGRSTSVGDRFKVFVVGYARFFNQETTQCNDVSFKPSWNLLPAQKLTIERRKAMNELALALNKALVDATVGFRDQGVSYIDYDNDFTGHRFCDRDEPSPDDPETYFFNWYTKDDPKLGIAQKLFEKIPAYQASVNGANNTVFKTDEDYINALSEAAGDDPEAQSVLSDSVRLFHPTTRGHDKIRDVVLIGLAGNGIPTEPPPAPQPQPTAVQPTEDSCDVSYKFFYDKFEVRGKNFPDAKMGVNGEGLKKQIKGCGAIEHWKYKLTPDDVKYQWYASGTLPIGTKACVGKAVESAGGTSLSHCHGSG